MEIVKKDYIPSILEFKLPEDVIIPKTLGNFKTEDEAREFVAKTFVATQIKVDATRFMDDHEKEELREDYQNELENVLPELEMNAFEKHLAADQAKAEAKNADDRVSASNTKVRDLAKEVKGGVKTIALDNKNTWRIPLEGKYYYVTFINNTLSVAKVMDIPDDERNDLLNSMNSNEAAFKKLKIKSA